MAPKIIDVEQGSEEWFKVRAGMPTASEFSTVLASGRGGGESLTRRTYMNKLAAEIVTGQPCDDGYTNRHMERGKQMEAEARDTYAFIHGVTPQLVGFVINGPIGCSPDSLIGDDGVLEIKTALPQLVIDHIRKGTFPSVHYAQAQGALLVTGRKWCDLAVYWPSLPLFVKRTYRDEDYLQDLRKQLVIFQRELDEVVHFIRQYGGLEEPNKVLREQLQASVA